MLTPMQRAQISMLRDDATNLNGQRRCVGGAHALYFSSQNPLRIPGGINLGEQSLDRGDGVVLGHGENLLSFTGERKRPK